jgi:hypothetical protein
VEWKFNSTDRGAADGVLHIHCSFFCVFVGCFWEDMLKRRWTVGNRSSVDEGSVGGTEDETTVVEPEQGNGESCVLPAVFFGREGEEG